MNASSKPLAQRVRERDEQLKLADEKGQKASLLLQVYQQFGHDMPDSERALVRQRLYDLFDVGVTAALKPEVDGGS